MKRSRARLLFPPQQCFTIFYLVILWQGKQVIEEQEEEEEEEEEEWENDLPSESACHPVKDGDFFD